MSSSFNRDMKLLRAQDNTLSHKTNWQLEPRLRNTSKIPLTLNFVWILDQLYMFQGHMESFWITMFKRESKFSNSNSDKSYGKL